MKLYTNSKGQWCGTQADARKQFRKDRREVEVPVDKAGLMAFLNDHRVGATTEEQGEPLARISSSKPEILSPQASSWVSWALEKLQHNDRDEAEAMLIKGLTIQYEQMKG
tara:strand:+ start:218 stop:547 length:330 start_codon:yes stop_codon:yes gene_type:complete